MTKREIAQFYKNEYEGFYMDIPVFSLPGILKDKDDTADFEGPLTLILELLRKHKVEIKDISISLILDQYLEYLDQMAELNLDIASEFVAMASHLMYIKTNVMLRPGEEVSELEELISSLEKLQRGETYQQIKEVAQALSGMYTRDGLMMTGPGESLTAGAEYRYVHISQELLDAIYRVVGKENLRLSSINTREPAYPEPVVSITDKIEEIVDRLKRDSDLLVTELFQDCTSRSELVAVLIAILELCRVGSAQVTGDTGDTSSSKGLTISYLGAGREGEITDFTIEDANTDMDTGDTD